ncbi:MAG: hypothetical protein ACI4EY_12400 [Lachnospiraceae bacterium]
MEYTIISKEGKSYDLPTYDLKIAEKMEEVEIFKRSGARVKAQFEKMYSFCSDILGKENTEEILGDVNKADPNMINFVYLDIVKAYNKPLEDYERKERASQFDDESIKYLMKLLGKAENVSKLIEGKK